MDRTIEMTGAEGQDFWRQTLSIPQSNQCSIVMSEFHQERKRAQCMFQSGRFCTVLPRSASQAAS
jgi:hypothetical protein